MCAVTRQPEHNSRPCSEGMCGRYVQNYWRYTGERVCSASHNAHTVHIPTHTPPHKIQRKCCSNCAHIPQHTRSGIPHSIQLLHVQESAVFCNIYSGGMFCVSRAVCMRAYTWPQPSQNKATSAVFRNGDEASNESLETCAKIELMRGPEGSI